MRLSMRLMETANFRKKFAPGQVTVASGMEKGCRRRTDSVMKRRELVAIGLFACFLAACGNNKPFDSVAWLKADARERGRMSQHLVDSKILLGLNT